MNIFAVSPFLCEFTNKQVRLCRWIISCGNSSAHLPAWCLSKRVCLQGWQKRTGWNSNCQLLSTAVSCGGYAFWVTECTRLQYNFFCQHGIQKSCVILGNVFFSFHKLGCPQVKNSSEYKTSILLSKIIRISFQCLLNVYILQLLCISSLILCNLFHET